MKKCKDPQCLSQISPNEAPQYCPAHNDQNPGTPDILPMGVSQWRAYGQKYGYWDFFVNQNRNAVSNFRCSEHGEQIPTPTCPKCVPHSKKKKDR